MCKTRYKKLHQFYHSLCPTCAVLNYTKRKQTCNLQGRVALVTGGRVKIGFCVALKLLRWGCTVVVTTRFPNDCALRYSKENDYNIWRYVYSKSKESVHRVYGKHCRLTSLLLLPLSNLFHCLFHDLLYSKITQTSLF